MALTGCIKETFPTDSATSGTGQRFADCGGGHRQCHPRQHDLPLFGVRQDEQLRLRLRLSGHDVRYGRRHGRRDMLLRRRRFGV